jgi:hypothetical protein
MKKTDPGLALNPYPEIYQVEGKGKDLGRV